MIDTSYLERNIEILSETGCWIWLGYCNPDGYGQRKIKGVTYRMHRVSYALYIGPIGNLQVLHRCDVPSCCNPHHLFLGTHSANMQDMWNKKRHAPPRKGQGSKLTKEQVEEIRGMRGKISGLALSKQYIVNDQTIRNIWKGVCH